MSRILLTAVLAIAAHSVFAEDQPAAADRGQVSERADEMLMASPAEVLRIRGKFQDRQAAKAAPVQHDYDEAIDQNVLSIEDLFDIKLEPDARPPQVFISKWQSTAISFVDAYGKPWPIRHIGSFLDGKVLIEKAVPEAEKAKGKDDAGSSTGIDINDPQAGSITVTALQQGFVGNFTVFLVNNPTPISITLVTKPAMYHRLATMRVGAPGPQTSKADLFRDSGITLGTEADEGLNHALYGVSPDGAEPMVVEGGEGRAWSTKDALYLQTPLAVFSPQILRTSPGNGRYHAYKLVPSSVVMATNDEGRTITLRIARPTGADILSSNATK